MWKEKRSPRLSVHICLVWAPWDQSPEWNLLTDSCRLPPGKALHSHLLMTGISVQVTHMSSIFLSSPSKPCGWLVLFLKLCSHLVLLQECPPLAMRFLTWPEAMTLSPSFWTELENLNIRFKVWQLQIYISLYPPSSTERERGELYSWSSRNRSDLKNALHIFLQFYWHCWFCDEDHSASILMMMTLWKLKQA